MGKILGFIAVSGVFWFLVFSIKLDSDDDLIGKVKGMVCPEAESLFVRIHRMLDDDTDADI